MQGTQRYKPSYELSYGDEIYSTRNIVSNIVTTLGVETGGDLSQCSFHNVCKYQINM